MAETGTPKDSHLYLVHHGHAVGPDVDFRQPLSSVGREQAERAASTTAARGARPDVVWHSGKLRARQTAEIFWRACNALAELSAVNGLQPADPPAWIADRISTETRDILIVGHFPQLPRLVALLLNDTSASPERFPQHGVVALASGGHVWREIWRVDAEGEDGKTNC